jgi:hypothetical protein
MSLRFRGGERIQRGRGIGGILRFAKSLFTPILSKLGGKAVKVAQSQAGKIALNALKEQAIDSGLKLSEDLVRGNDMKESLRNEVGKARIRTAKTIEKINKKRKGNFKHNKRKKDILYG